LFKKVPQLEAESQDSFSKIFWLLICSISFSTSKSRLLFSEKISCQNCCKIFEKSLQTLFSQALKSAIFKNIKNDFSLSHHLP
jgi:hypothetical protein